MSTLLVTKLEVTQRDLRQGHALCRNVNESEKEFVCPPRDTDPLQDVMCSFLAHATFFHQVSGKSGQ